jgi:hypothetical protein
MDKVCRGKNKIKTYEHVLSILIAGFGGGIVRGLIGFLRNQYSYKTSTFNISYFLVR